MKRPRLFDIIVILLMAILIIVCLIIYLCRFSGGISSSQEIFGQFGDYIGGVVGTAVSLFSLVYIYKTYRKQVEFSQHELTQSSKQQFEASFFSLLQNQRSILLSLSHGNSAGNDFFIKVSEDLQERMMEREYAIDEITYENRFKEEDIVCSIYEHLYNVYGRQLGHYFRNLYHIISYVEQSDVDNKKLYIDLIQSQLSNSELFVLFYDGISRYGKRRLHPLLEKYKFLENVNYSDFDYFYRHQAIFYPMTQFKYCPASISKIVFLGGVHGVGKNTLCSSIDGSLDVVHFSASDLLKWNEISKDSNNKKVKDVDETQNRLIAALRDAIEPSKKYILDGHFCLLKTDGGISKVPFETFRAINPCAIAVMTDKPAAISKRLSDRDNKEYPVELIRTFQEEEVKWSKEVAKILDIPYIELNSCDKSSFQSFLIEAYSKELMKE